VVAEVLRQRLVRRRGETKQLGYGGLGVPKKRRTRFHCEMRVGSCSMRVPSLSTTSRRTGM
jgi:hypothetical protein